MQDPLATVEPFYLDIPGNNLRSPSPRSQYATATAAAAAAPGDWSGESFVDNGIRMVFQNDSLRHSFRNSDDQLDILGQFEFVYASHIHLLVPSSLTFSKSVMQMGR